MKNLYTFIYAVIFLFLTLNSKASNYYWVGDAGNWSDSSHVHWATSSGGSSFYSSPPTSSDNVYFDANSFSLSAVTVSIDIAANCNTMDWTGAGHGPHFSNSASALNIYGSLTLITGMTAYLYGTTSFLSTTTGQTITIAGRALYCPFVFNGAGGAWTLQDAFAITGNYDISLLAGTLTTNDKAITCRNFISTGTLTRTLNMGASVFTLSGFGTSPFWNITGSGITISAGTSHINNSLTLTTYDLNFTGGGNTYYDVSFTGTTGTHSGIINDNNTFHNVTFAANGKITGSNTFDSLTFAGTHTYILTAGKTQTINYAITTSGAGCSTGVTLQSSSSSVSTISKSSGSLTVSYVSLTWMAATGGATFTANNSIDGGHNTGWTINSPTATISYAGTPFCQSVSSGQSVTLTGQSGGVYSSTSGLGISSGTGSITPASSTAGSYTVTYIVASAGICPADTAHTSVVITPLPVATFSYAGTPYCKDASNPSPSYSGGGAAGTFSSTTGLVFVSTSTGQVNLSASTAGTYTVTNSIAASGGCATVTATNTITINTVPAANAGSNTTICKGSSITIGASAVSGNTYSWVSSPADSSFTNTVANPSVTPQVTTTYTLTEITTLSGCAHSNSITVTVNPVPGITLGTMPLIPADTTTAYLPYTSPVNSPNQYSITWNSAAITAGFTNVVNATLPADSIVISVPDSVAAAVYYGTLWVSNSGTSCQSDSMNITVTVVNSLPAISLTLPIPVCDDIGDTTVILSYSAVANGADQYTVLFDSTAHAAGYADVAYTTIPASPIIIPVPSTKSVGTVNATVKVKNSGSGAVSINYPVVITIIARETSTAAVTNASCHGQNNGQIVLTVTGGLAPYTYLWSSGATTKDIYNLTAGTYSVTVRDANGCNDTLSATVTQPDTLTVTSASLNVSCYASHDGSITLTVSGGSTPYNYSWSNGATSASLSGLAGGIYNATVADINGCSATAADTITEPIQVTVSAVVTNVSCHGASDGYIAITHSAGATVTIKNSASLADVTSSNGALPPATYLLTATAPNGNNTGSCVAVDTVFVTEPPALIVSISSYTNVTCNGGADGAATATVSGGTTAYSYLWQPGGMTGPADSNLIAGSYTITVTDAHACTATAVATISQPAALAMSLTPSVYNAYNVAVHGGSNGSVSAGITGGVLPYIYSWSNGATASSIDSLVAGSYSLTVTDSNNCTVSGSITLTQPTALHVDSLTSALYNGYNVSCQGGSNGSAHIVISGGIMFTGLGASYYQYSWSNGAGGTWNTKYISSAPAGTYTVQVTDANGAVLDTTITLSAPPALIDTLSVSHYNNGYNVSVMGASDGWLSVAVTGGVTPYIYAWRNVLADGSIGSSYRIDSLSAGQYAFEVIDANSCIINGERWIVQPSTYNGAWGMAGNAKTDPAYDFVGTTDSTDFVVRTNNAEALRIKPNGISTLAGSLKINGVLQLDTASADSLRAVYLDKDGNLQVSGEYPETPDGGGGGNPLRPPHIPPSVGACVSLTNHWLTDYCSHPNDIFNNPFSGNVGIGCAPNQNEGTNYNYKLDVAGVVHACEVKVDLNNGCDFVFDDKYKLIGLPELEKYLKEHKHLPDMAPAKEMEANGVNVGDLEAKLLQKIEELTLYTIDLQKQVDELKKQIKK